MCAQSRRIQFKEQDWGHRCQTLCRICTYAPLIANISSPTSDPSGEQQSSRPRLVPSSNTSSKSSQLGSRISVGGRKGGVDAVAQQPESRNSCVAGQGWYPGSDCQPISTLHLMLMWFPSNRLYKSVCCTLLLLSSYFPPVMLGIAVCPNY